MLFQTISFLLFLALTFALYWAFPRTRMVTLAAANSVFYLAAGLGNLVLFLGVAGLTYGLGAHVRGPWGRWVLGLGVALNLANLCFFKYSHFLLSSLSEAFTFQWLDPSVLTGLLLPIGISFYTFQHISYLVDRRYKDLPPAPSFAQFWVYISFFGHSIAGPIMRGHEFLPQIAETTHKRLGDARLQYGAYLFMLGLTKKVVIADRLALQVNPLFARPLTLTFGEAWVAALYFAFQIYFDFSAYSDMAVGIGHMFGYDLRQNFKTPYIAGNAREFWQRWHITLSHWIRDYVYIPLGGSRGGSGRTQLNLFLAMLVSGLWHGAAYTFLVWGAFHGMLLLGLKGWEDLKARLAWRFFEGRLYHAGAVAGFFLLVTVGWVPFRAASLEDAVLIGQAMTDVASLATLVPLQFQLGTILALYGLHVFEAWARTREALIGAWWQERVPTVVQGTAYAGLVLAIMGSYIGSQDFIYFRF